MPEGGIFSSSSSRVEKVFSLASFTLLSVPCETVKIGQESQWSSPTKNRSIDRRDTAESTTRRVIRSVERIERKGNTSPGCSKEAAACSTPSRLPCNFIFAASPLDFGFAPSLDTIEQNLQRRKFRFSSEGINFRARNVHALNYHFSFSFSFQRRDYVNSMMYMKGWG